MQAPLADVHVRDEEPGDAGAVARVNEQAFGQPDEARIVAAIRQGGHPSISLVATYEGAIVGHILFTPVTFVEGDRGIDAMGLGPMAVLPDWQRRGVGTRLVKAGLERCASVGCQMVVVVGHPEYYPRFGFEPASRIGLSCEYDVPDEVFMARALTPGILGGGPGRIRYLREFGGS